MKAVDERIEECDGLDVRIEKAGLLKNLSASYLTLKVSGVPVLHNVRSIRISLSLLFSQSSTCSMRALVFSMSIFISFSFCFFSSFCCQTYQALFPCCRILR